MIADSL